MMSHANAQSSGWKGTVTFFGISLAATVLLIMFVSGNFSSADKSAVNSDGSTLQAIVYKSPTCGCCTNYVAYLRRRKFLVDAVDVEDMGKIKEQQKIPAGLESCHTTVIGQYVVEGHIPVEAINKLLTEKPAIAGIALAGMPSGSPGMPGAKEPFEIHTITQTGEDGGIFIVL